MNNIGDLLLSLEAKRDELRRIKEKSDYLKKENDSNTEYLNEQIDKLKKEIVSLESRKLTIKKTMQEINDTLGKCPFRIVDLEWSNIQKKSVFDDSVRKVDKNINLVKQLHWPMIVLLVLFLLSIFLHTGPQLQMTEYGTMYPVTYSEAISMGHPYEENHGISETLETARLLNTFSWAAPVGYIATAFLMVLNFRLYAVVGIVAACVDLIVFLSWNSIFDSMLSVIRYYYMDQNMSLVFLPKMYICVLCAVGVCALCIYLLIQERNNASGEKLLLHKLPTVKFFVEDPKVSIMVSNYNRLSELRMAYVNCFGSGGIEGFSLVYVDYNTRPLTDLVVDIFFYDGIQTMYAVHNCRFRRFKSNGEHSFISEKLQIRSDVLSVEQIEDVDVIIKQYSRSEIAKKEIPSYVKNTLTREQQFILKKSKGTDAVVRPEISDDSWQCVCGNINLNSQENCCLCSRRKALL